jgi:2-aminoadipate transaminase
MREFNFGGGMPDPKSFPSQGLAEAAAKVLPRLGETLVRYPDGRGYIGLREIAAERFEKNNGVALPVDRIALTTGSMQAISLICQTFLQPGDTIITEEYSYSGSLGCFRKYQANMVGVAVDDEGMDMDALEDTLKNLARRGDKPKFIYTIATNQNPTGTMMPESRRRRLLELANAHEVPVVEDDCYADLIFEGNAPATICSLDPENVVYIGSFSKILGPGVRLGFFSANEDLLTRILSWKIDGGTNNLAAYVVAEFFKDHLWEHVAVVNRVVKEKLAAVIEQLEARRDVFVDFSHPQGGLFIWVKLPDDVDPVRAMDIANARGIRYGSGKAFHSRAEDIKYLRLAFGYPSLDDIRDGLPLLAQCVEQARVAVAVTA